MAKQVQAFKDSSGRLHESESAADVADMYADAQDDVMTMLKMMPGPRWEGTEMENAAKWLVGAGAGYLLSSSSRLRIAMGGKAP